jgi:hypothetical protein
MPVNPSTIDEKIASLISVVKRLYPASVLRRTPAQPANVIVGCQDAAYVACDPICDTSTINPLTQSDAHGAEISNPVDEPDEPAATRWVKSPVWDLVWVLNPLWLVPRPSPGGGRDDFLCQSRRRAVLLSRCPVAGPSRVVRMAGIRDPGLPPFSRRSGYAS